MIDKFLLREILSLRIFVKFIECYRLEPKVIKSGVDYNQERLTSKNMLLSSRIVAKKQRVINNFAPYRVSPDSISLS